MSDEEGISLPVTTNPKINITLPPDIQVGDSLNQVKSVDLQVTNDMLKACYFTLGHAKTVSSMCKAIEVTLNTVERRRKLLNLQYGAPNQVSKTEEFDPLD